MSGVGARLREAREERGISLEQAERETRIIRRYISALETDDLDAFPAEVYARGFLRSYANYLGLRPDDFLRLMPRSATASQALEPRGGKQRPPRTEARAGSSRAPRATSKRVEHPGRRLVLFVAGGLVAAAVLGYAAGGDPDPAALPTGARVRSPSSGGDAPAGGAPVSGRMPDLVGMNEADALRRLAELGIAPFVIKAPSREAPAGQVLRQSPSRNAPIGSGVVTIVVSAGG